MEAEPTHGDATNEHDEPVAPMERKAGKRRTPAEVEADYRERAERIANRDRAKSDKLLARALDLLSEAAKAIDAKDAERAHRIRENAASLRENLLLNP